MKPDTGVWVARYADRSSVCVFATELHALRHAVANSMEVAYIPWGEDATTYVKPRPKPRPATAATEEAE